jgi:hypothetical protein
MISISLFDLLHLTFYLSSYNSHTSGYKASASQNFLHYRMPFHPTFPVRSEIVGNYKLFKVKSA